jgi:hypothetical protein
MSFNEIFADSYRVMTDLTDKPLLIAEVGCVESGGSKPDWIRQAFLADIPHYFPRIRAIVWFNQDRTPYGEADWRVDTSSDSLRVYTEVAQAPYYHGCLDVGTRSHAVQKVL